MVWIHGGDHTDGDGGQPMYNTPSFPERGCVLVTINYRLGLMGFFAHPDLAAESPDGGVRATTGCSTRSPRSNGCATTSQGSAVIRAR